MTVTYTIFCMSPSGTRYPLMTRSFTGLSEVYDYVQMLNSLRRPAIFAQDVGAAPVYLHDSDSIIAEPAPLP